jgi:hypothetical protein
MRNPITANANVAMKKTIEGVGSGHATMPIAVVIRNGTAKRSHS